MMKCRVVCFLLVMFLLSHTTISMGHDPSKLPSKEELEKLQREGKLDEAKRRLNWLQQHRIGEGLGNRAYYRLQQDVLRAQGKTDEQILSALYGTGPNRRFPFTGVRPELKSTGTVKTVTVLIDFKDHAANPHMTRDHLQTCIYGDGTSSAQALHAPYESLNAYYKRASEGKVDIQGNVLPWYSFAENRSKYEPNPVNPAGLSPNDFQMQEMIENQKALFKMISTALTAADTSAAGHDFKQYDNDNDGDIDCVNVLYAGPPGSWSSFWWAYQWKFFINEAATKKFDGKRVRQFVFQFMDRRTPNEFDPTTLMHETGHAFGLPDYYDYDGTKGPDGGIGGLDMMDSNWGNHNAFSRWLLDWVRPTVISSGTPQSVEILASSEQNDGTKKAIAISPTQSSSTTPTGDLYLVELRCREGNDGGNRSIPADGLLIWRVDATPNADNTDFQYDNSYTDKKLIQLVRADSNMDFDDSENATGDVFFAPPKEFTPSSSPTSSDWGVTLKNLQLQLDEKKATFLIGFDQTNPVPSLAHDDETDQIKSELVQQVVQAINTKDKPITISDIDQIIEIASVAPTSEVSKAAEEAGKLIANLDRPTVSHQVLFENLTLTLASKSGEGAIAMLQKSTPDKIASEKLAASVLGEWSKQNPTAASSWIKKNPKEASAMCGIDFDAIFPPTIEKTSFEGNPFKINFANKTIEMPVFDPANFVDSIPGPRPAASINIQVAGYNLESGDAQITSLAGVIGDFSGIDIWGFSEVDDSWADSLQTAAAVGEGSTYGQVLGTTGNADRLMIVYNESKFRYVDDFELHEINPREGGIRKVRSALVGQFEIVATGQQMYFMVNHLYRGRADKRHLQSEWLNQWARAQTIPIVAVGDYNYDWEVVGGDTNHDEGYDLLTKDDVFKWVRPSTLVKSQTGPSYNSVLDFVFANQLAYPSAQSSTIIVRADDSPDDNRISDHRPVFASFRFAASTPTPSPRPRMEGPRPTPIRAADWAMLEEKRSRKLQDLSQDELLETAKLLQRDLKEQQRLAAGLD